MIFCILWNFYCIRLNPGLSHFIFTLCIQSPICILSAWYFSWNNKITPRIKRVINTNLQVMEKCHPLNHLIISRLGFFYLLLSKFAVEIVLAGFCSSAPLRCGSVVLKCSRAKLLESEQTLRRLCVCGRLSPCQRSPLPSTRAVLCEERPDGGSSASSGESCSMLEENS